MREAHSRPQVRAPRDGSDPAEAVSIEDTLTYGFQLDQAGKWCPFGFRMLTQSDKSEAIFSHKSLIYGAYASAQNKNPRLLSEPGVH
jgi:hypothetical protein